MDLTIKCKHCGFEHTSNLYRGDKHTIEKRASNNESCPNCGQVSTYGESDYNSTSLHNEIFESVIIQL